MSSTQNNIKLYWLATRAQILLPHYYTGIYCVWVDLPGFYTDYPGVRLHSCDCTLADYNIFIAFLQS